MSSVLVIVCSELSDKGRKLRLIRERFHRQAFGADHLDQRLRFTVALRIISANQLVVNLLLSKEGIQFAHGILPGGGKGESVIS